MRALPAHKASAANPIPGHLNLFIESFSIGSFAEPFASLRRDHRHCGPIFRPKKSCSLFWMPFAPPVLSALDEISCRGPACGESTAIRRN
jgi:hypothetical protein